MLNRIDLSPELLEMYNFFSVRAGRGLQAARQSHLSNAEKTVICTKMAF